MKNLISHIKPPIYEQVVIPILRWKTVEHRLCTILTLSALAALVGLIQLNKVASATNQLMQQPLTTERLVSDWYRYIHSGIKRTAAIAKSADPSLAKFFEADQAESSKASAELLKQITDLLQSEQEKALLKEINALRDEYLASRNKIVEMKKADQADEANQLLEQNSCRSQPHI
jgi:methyl-accepting chemotaxis protein